VVGTVTDEALFERIARLERLARRDRTVALGMLALFLATAQAPAPSAPLAVSDPSGAGARITASGLAVHDAAGRVRIAAGIDGDDHPGFSESDASGMVRQWAFLVDGLPVVRQFDAQGHRRLELHVASGTQNPGFETRDASGERRMALFRGDSGNPEVDLFGSDGKVRAYLETDEDVPFLVMKDRAANTRIVMGAYASGKIGMDIRDAGGTARWSKP